MERADAGRNTESTVLDTLSLRCLLDIHVDLLRQEQYWVVQYWILKFRVTVQIGDNTFGTIIWNL